MAPPRIELGHCPRQGHSLPLAYGAFHNIHYNQIFFLFKFSFLSDKIYISLLFYFLMNIKRGKHFFNFKKFNKKAQLTIFIIIALIIVSGTIIFLIFKNNLFNLNNSKTIQPVLNTLDSCIQNIGKEGVYLLEVQGGYIYLPEYEEGSYNFPSSSYLNFLGNSVPFWDYYSPSSINKIKIPTKESMEKQLKNFIESKIYNCGFSENYNQNYEIDLKNIEIYPKIENNKIIIDSNFDLNIKLNNESFSSNNYKTEIKTNLGILYEDALKVYNKNKKEFILENYTIDILRMYAPVDGFEISCSPKIWETQSIFYTLKEVIPANIRSINSKNKNPSNSDFKYFYQNFNTKGDVNFLTDSEWPMFMEVNPSQGNFLVSNPVGNTPELSLLGFCFVNYHFVYSLNYPVLVQVSKDNEIFQFPILVYINKNKPKESLTKPTSYEDADLCSNKNVPIKIFAYDSNSNPIKNFEAEYECLNQKCFLGNSSFNNTFLIPECFNGILTIKSSGYSDIKSLLSDPFKESEINLFLNKEYNKNLQILVDNSVSNEQAIISFKSDDFSKDVLYPKEKNVSLTKGIYNISVQIYKNISMNLPEYETEICLPSKSGIKGFFGISEKVCSKIKVPSSFSSNVIIGGGSVQNYEINDGELSNSNVLQLKVSPLKIPNTFLELTQNSLNANQNKILVNII